MIENIITLLNSPAFINFISTFGLAAVIVVFFVFIRDPRQLVYWQQQFEKLIKVYNDSYTELSNSYKGLEKSYSDLEKDMKTDSERFDKLDQEYRELVRINERMKDDYRKLENDLKPETRTLSRAQARAICHTGLDRDLYKLFYYIKKIIEENSKENLKNCMGDTILDTNNMWSQFVSPFPLVQNMRDLYGVYTNHGESLCKDLQDILDSGCDDTEKINMVWNKLREITIYMKREFDDNIENLSRGQEVRPYIE